MPVRRAGSYHVPAMAEEVLRYLAPFGNGLWVDNTLGGGGHSRLIGERLGSEGMLLALDRDPLALEAGGAALEGLGCRVFLERAHFSQVGGIVDQFRLPVEGALWDLGLSSAQIDRGGGFSFTDTGQPLDLRQDPSQDVTAQDVLNSGSAQELADMIYRNSDERFSRRIAAQVVRMRPLKTVGDLVGAVEAALPRGYRSREDVLRRTMQAVRMEVNRELQELAESLEAMMHRLGPGGRMVVLSYHSGEDRVVKHFLRDRKREKTLRLLTPSPLRPQKAEVLANPRSKPARLRAAERC